MQIEDFQPHVGKTFHFEAAGHKLTLSQATPTTPNAARAAPFLLIFSGPAGPGHLPEGLHGCRLDSGEAFEFYIQPIHTPAMDRQDYQVVFN